MKSLTTALLAAAALSLNAAPASLTIDATQPGAAISPALWGIFFEDINLSADGGIYPELVRNRSFEDSANPEHWKIETAEDSKTRMSVDDKRPLTPMNRHSLKMDIQGRASLGNGGYWGMNMVQGDGYAFRVAARAAEGFTGPVAVAIEGADGKSLASGEITGLTDQWKYYSLDLTAAGSDPKARLTLSVSGKGTLWLDMVSLMPKKTWKDHGLRPDLCGMLDGLKPSFMRFPGGCWVEGDDMAHMNHWKKTIGDVGNREPLWNLWGYNATHGLGYHEYLQLSEDLGAEPLFCINVGMSHHEVIPMDQMGQWVQDALDAIEYANGPVTSVWGGLRAKNGHPAPFNMKYLEIGNENGGPAYHERWELFHKAIKARHPEMRLIANVWGGYPTNQMPEIVDEHYYSNPEFFMREASHYDKYDRKGPKIFVGEYAVTSGCGLGNLRGAIGEAAFMTGLERNADIVVMACYAPLFVNLNHRKWNPDLINFDSSRVYGLPSYYVQKLFSEHRGNVILPVAVDCPMVAEGGKSGKIGVGTWNTQAEYKDIKVTRGNETLYACDFSKGTEGWKLLGGDWKVEEGALRQNARGENVRALVGDANWSDYTLSLKARKLDGAEGFLILFNTKDENQKSWWNLGGWNNSKHAVEIGGIVGNEVPGQIETGKWYDIRIELQGGNAKCYLDGKLMHDIAAPAIKSLYASASRVNTSGEVIVKVVNAASDPIETTVTLKGIDKVAGPIQSIVLASEKAEDENSLEQPQKVAPRSSTIPAEQGTLNHAFPGNSLTIWRVPVTK